jgi:hypothetical protein
MREKIFITMIFKKIEDFLAKFGHNVDSYEGYQRIFAPRGQLRSPL